MTASNETTLPENDSGISTPQKQPRYRVYPLWIYGIIIIFFCATHLLIYWYCTSGPYYYPYEDNWIFPGVVAFLVCIAISLKRVIAISLIAMFVIIVAVWLLSNFAPEIHRRRSLDLTTCRFNLEEIGELLKTYHKQHKCFPPVIVRDKNDKPTHSWRGLVLKVFREDEKKEKSKRSSYDLSLSWNSSKNQNVIEEILTCRRPFLFECHAFRKNGDEIKCLDPTNYFAVIGTDTAWNKNEVSRSLDDISDPANTALVIELTDLDIRAGEPKDVTLDDLTSGRISWSQLSRHPYTHNCLTYQQPGTNILFADGSVRYCIGTPTLEEIRNLFSITKEKVATEAKSKNSIHVFGDLDVIRAKQPIRAAVYYTWIVCLITIFAAIFFPRKEIA